MMCGVFKNFMVYLTCQPLILATLCVISESANILYVMPFTSKSHNIMLRPLGLELARRGHNVTCVTAYEEANAPPTFHQVLADNTTIWEATGVGRPNVFTMTDLSNEAFHDAILWRGGLASTEISLKSHQVQEFLKKQNTFDLVISELFFQEAMYALAYKYNAPLVLITTFGNCMRHNMITGNPLQLATVPPEFEYIRQPMSFLARLKTLYFVAYEHFWWRYWYMDFQTELAEKYIPGLPQPMPSLLELQRNASLLLVNRHFSFETPMAYLPNIVEVAGLHLKESTIEIPKDLKEILDNSKFGVIYMNFGSNVKSSELPKEKRDAFLNVFRKLKQTVLWKWEDDNIKDKPKNVIIRKWLPQNNILAHPNVKLFVAHGGLIGMQEAIFHGVPVIGVPIYGDQYNNLLQAQEIGFGRILDYHSINEHNLESILKDVLENASYRLIAKEMSRRFQDRPLSALDTAMFWIEYVIRNKGAEFMKSPAAKLSWVTYNMLDVYAFILIVLLAVFLVLYKVLKGFMILINLKPIAEAEIKKRQ